MIKKGKDNILSNKILRWVLWINFIFIFGINQALFEIYEQVYSI